MADDYYFKTIARFYEPSHPKLVRIVLRRDALGQELIEVHTRTKLRATMPWIHENSVTVSLATWQAAHTMIDQNARVGLQVDNIVISLTEEQYKQIESGELIPVEVEHV